MSGTGQPASNQPVFKDRVNRMDVAIWKNDKGYSISLQKSFKKKDDAEWTRHRISLFPDEVDGLIALVAKAKDFLQKEGIKTSRAEQV